MNVLAGALVVWFAVSLLAVALWALLVGRCRCG